MKLDVFLKTLPENAEVLVSIPNENDNQNPKECKFLMGDKEYVMDALNAREFVVDEIDVAPKFYVDCKPYPFHEDEDDEDFDVNIDIDGKIYEMLEMFAEAEGVTAEELAQSIIKEWIENVEVVDV